MNNGESVTGDNNIIIGQKQGQSLTSGDNNIFIGSGSKGTGRCGKSTSNRNITNSHNFWLH